jgi:hypothetical protein
MIFRMPARWIDPAGNSAHESEWKFLLVVFVVACLLIITRRPDAISTPQFYAEDGVFWYADAHNLGGVNALFLPYASRGYFCTVPRLAGLVTQTMPLLWAPLIFNIIAIAIQAIPATVVASRRFASAVPLRWARLVLAFLYVALPTAWGTISNVTHSQWHLAMVAVFVVVAIAPQGHSWRGFDIVVTALSGLTGPLCLVMTPIAVIVWYVRQTPWALVLMLVTGTAAAIQGVSLLLWSTSAGSYPPLEASIVAFEEIFARRVVYGALIGHRLSVELIASYAAAWTNASVLIVIALCGAASLTYALLYAPFALRLLILFGFLVMLSGLLWPVRGQAAGAYWETLMVPGVSPRYFHALIFALVASFVWMLSRSSSFARAGGAVPLLFMVTMAVPFDWREPAYRNYHFSVYVQRYDRAAGGAMVQIPTPQGWSMILRRRWDRNNQT